MNRSEEIDRYIEGFEGETRRKLEILRELIREAAPLSREKISYQMPTFDYHGNLIHFAGYKGHVGLYPSPSGITAFEDELKGYKTSKGAIQFPTDEPLPLELIRKIVIFRVEENRVKHEEKAKKKK